MTMCSPSCGIQDPCKFISMVCLASIGKDSLKQDFTEVMLMRHDCADVNGLEDNFWFKNATVKADGLPLFSFAL